ncbi:MAG: valine--tRNA ligase [Patescibacteria group bacterium]
MSELDKPYNPQETENKIYELWEKSGYFNPDNLPFDLAQGKPFSMVMPPPNVTGVLHIGHALMLTIEDMIIRFQRMRGRRALWIPGTDHAAIATQSKVEEIIYKKEGKTRHDLGREEFLKRVNQFAQESRNTIINQIKRMGASCDWSREAYTLDEQRNIAVRTAFKQMYEDGLIYRGKRIVNWDPKMQTTVSDDEIEWEEQSSPLYYLKYGPFTIATARPETKFGDKYVVMHPDDARYQQYKDGQKIELEWINGLITATVIKDDAVDMEFGTGTMTITPWHDMADFEIAERHNLDFEQIIDEQGKLLPIAGEFAGAHIKKARPLIVEKLKLKGLVEKINENYTHRIAVNSRGGGIIEPQIKEQWFVSVKNLKKQMRDVVESGQIKIIPEHFQKTYFHWIDNLRDWCISRQIWFGHQIPVWYHEPRCIPKKEKVGDFSQCHDIIVSVDVNEPQCQFCDAKYIQDPDTLDTWFSSGLWTFSTLGWPNQTKDLATYHPTDILETGYDILFFWVARMILMTTYLLKQIPFKTVYLHGLVRDKDRQKMSKSKGNIIDPLGVIDIYGTDALRFALIFSTSAGTDIPLAEDKIRGMKNFANKLWNITRYILSKVDTESFQSQPKVSNDIDRVFLEKLNQTTQKVTKKLTDLSFHEAAQEIYDFTWHELADKYIEHSKTELNKEILAHGLMTVLKLLHPFMPFITEEIYQKLPITDKKLLMIENWPVI